jgi:Predicted methyltransferase regulatory domain/Methyltransferase domain
MNMWTSGYVAEVDYPAGYYRELSPSLLSLALLNRNVSTAHQGAPRYLELGFGQGLSLSIHAAACPGEFWGTDFNPAHAANARELTEASGAGARIFNLSFAELAAREDLPEFDTIVIHGIWSWISEENRAVIVDIARRKLCPGGIFYIGYNCMPGWSPMLPLRHLMSLHAELAGSQDAGISRKIGDAMEFAQKVVDLGAIYFRDNPKAAEWLKRIEQQSRHYLAHEYFSRDWQPMPFSQVADQLAEAKLDFCASANLVAHVDELNLTPEWQELLGGISHPVLRESVRDCLLGQQFRKDIFVKGGRAMPMLDRTERLAAQSFVLTTPAQDVPMHLILARGTVNLPEAAFKPVLAALSENGHAPMTVGELVAHPACQGRPPAVMLPILVTLTGIGHVHPTQSPEAIKSAKPRCDALNARLFQRARHNGDAAYLASPVIGAGIPAPRVEQLFLLARQQGRDDPQAWAAFVWETIRAQGQRFTKDGKTLETEHDNLGELTTRAQQFADKQLPIFKALGIAG